MTNRRIVYISVSAVVLAVASSLPAASFAAGQQAGELNDQTQAQMLQQAKVSLTDAIQAAEAAEGGKASGATFDSSASKPRYEVEIIAPDGRIRSVFVDAESGQVTKATADAADTENGTEQEGGEHGENEAE
jgi:uncharacterized membrane protein YkoI